ncbi:uncharacterized protein K452DRAFT_218939 [Aplosporella prunicola CBS 121167]|uniref:Zinc/iron permease n=1 Tax=Aplosporella prunicola CBS 121167 TaxID=1176127 RepID=A0A6A6BRV4_9PEZI|nr:uncharacterized protein K452DRAFT_218939 [Aplosporella prunicola CBS 121167]KAF2146750.1 hypothetical protein K452DRAFT_218939 [Aplosporella prunicola CBS 121167]
MAAAAAANHGPALLDSRGEFQPGQALSSSHPGGRDEGFQPAPIPAKKHAHANRNVFAGLSAPSWSEIPYEFLRAELHRRQQDGARPACGSARKGTYNTPLHVFALVLILVLSTLACSFPIIVRRFPSLPVPHHFLFLSRHFGTGVLIATAFVHLLPTAYTSLTDPCLPPFWNDGYPAMAGLIAMCSVFVVVGIEMFFASRGAGHVHGGDELFRGEGDEHKHHSGANGRPRGHGRSGSYNRFRAEDDDFESRGASRGLNNLDTPGSSDNLVEGVSPLVEETPGSPPRGSRHNRNTQDEGEDSDSDLELPELDTADESGLLNGQRNTKYQHRHQRSSTDSRRALAALDPLDSSGHSPLSPHQQQQKQLLQCLLLEAGILFHSIFIGMAVSVATGPPFLVLLVAISFHQTFEGLALGSRIAALAFGARSPKPWFMALAYGTTTPIGQAIGLGIHNLYDPASETGLLTVGIMNAVSSGLLLFAGLVELLAEDFLSDASYEVLRGKRRLQACASVVAGAGLMALVGAWA